MARASKFRDFPIHMKQCDWTVTRQLFSQDFRARQSKMRFIQCIFLRYVRRTSSTIVRLAQYRALSLCGQPVRLSQSTQPAILMYFDNRRNVYSPRKKGGVAIIKFLTLIFSLWMVQAVQKFSFRRKKQARLSFLPPLRTVRETDVVVVGFAKISLRARTLQNKQFMRGTDIGFIATAANQ